MATQVKDFNNKVDSFLNGLPDAMIKINTEVALDSIAKITARLTDEGLTAEGKSLGKYSTNLMSPLFFLGHGLKSADAKIKAQIKKQQKAKQKTGVSYEQVREFNNLPTDHVTLSFTNDTLGDIGIIQDNVSGNLVITSIGSKDSKSKDIYNAKGKKTGTKTTGQVLDDLNDKYGSALDTDILDLSTEEEEEISKRIDQKTQNYLDKFFK